MALLLGAKGGYATPAGICVQTSQDTIIAEINKFKSLIDPAAGIQPTSPDFFHVEKHIATKLSVEIDAITAAIDAMAVV